VHGQSSHVRTNPADPAYRLPLGPRDGAVLGEFVRGLGLVASGFAAVQIDINPVRRRHEDVSLEVTLCDHNCTESVHGEATGGRYTCPAAMSLNPGVGSRDLAPADLLIKGLQATAAGIRIAQHEFLERDLLAYLEEQGVPERLHPEFEAALRSRKIVVNLFGGSPELHPGCLDIIEALHSQGIEVHLTTTGRRIVREPAFRADLLRMPPDVLAVSFDDVESVPQLDDWFALDFQQLGKVWRQVPMVHGQRRKAVEAVQICKLALVEPLPTLLFNIVIHPDNLGHIEELLDRLTDHVPGAILNPYPVQSAFLGQRGSFATDELDRLRHVAEVMVDVHVRRHLGATPRWNLAPRFNYWLLVLSLLSSGAAPDVRSDRVGGMGVWRCYARPGAGRCVQIGAAQRGISGGEFAGGHPGCFWNTRTVTYSRQFWDLNGGQLADWILHGRQRTASAAVDPCAGCLFPRMSLDGVSLELGLAADAVEGYRAMRARYLGY
jgi:hypothetical protein